MRRGAGIGLTIMVLLACVVGVIVTATRHEPSRDRASPRVFVHFTGPDVCTVQPDVIEAGLRHVVITGATEGSAVSIMQNGDLLFKRVATTDSSPGQEMARLGQGPADVYCLSAGKSHQEVLQVR